MSRDREVHGLLREDVRRAAAGAEEHAVPDGELQQAARRRGEHGAERGQRRAREHEPRRGRERVDVRRDVPADAESRCRECEDDRELRAAQPEQSFHRLQEDAERVERAERKIEHGGGGDRAPRARPRVEDAHETQATIRLSNNPSSVAAFSRLHASTSTRSHRSRPSALEARPRNFASISASVNGFR